MLFTCPKNFKSGRLISNKFTYLDLAIMVIGVIITIVLEAVYIIFLLNDNLLINIAFFILFTLPGLIAFAIVQPNGIYHNFLSFFHLLIIDISSPKEYIWGGLTRHEYTEEETKEIN